MSNKTLKSKRNNFKMQTRKLKRKSEKREKTETD